MRSFLIALFSLTATLFASDDQARSFQKILAFYKDEQYHLAKKNILTFLKENKTSPYNTALNQMLVYLYIKEGNIANAAALLENMESLSANPTLYLQYLDLLCQQKEFHKLLFALEKVENSSDFQNKKQDLCFYKALAFFDLAQKEPLLEKKQELFIEIKKLLGKSNKKTFMQPCLRMLFESEAFLQNHLEAANLAKQISAFDRKFLFYEAYHTLKVDPSKAFTLLTDLIKSDHEFKNQAAYLLIKTLHEQGQFKQIVSMEDGFKPFFSDPTIALIFCRALMELQQYKQAQEHLHQLIAKKMDAKLLYFAYHQLLKACLHLNEVSAFSKTLTAFKELFPKDDSLPTFQYHLGVLYKQNNELKAAIDQFESLYEGIMNVELRQNVLLSLVELYLKIEQPMNAYKFAKVLVKQKCDETTLSLFLHTLDKIATPPLALIELYLLQSKKLPTPFKAKIDLMMAQKATILQKNHLAKQKLLEILKTNREEQYTAQAHFLLGLILENPLFSTHHLELALSQKVELKDEQAIWSRLFNLYNLLHTSNTPLPKGHYHYGKSPQKLAAHYLYLTFEHDQKSLSQQHKLYLIDYLYEELCKDLTHSIRAKRNLFRNPAMLQLMTLFDKIDRSQLDEETHFIIEKKRAVALGLKGWHQEKIEILQSLLPLATIPVVKSEILYEMGESYKQLRLFGKAKKAFDEGRQLQGHFADYCALNWVQLNKERLDLKQKNLETLKEITLKKAIEYEPLFLIAGLEYIDISLFGMSKEEKNKRELFLIERFIEDFTHQEDPFALHYHQRKQALEDKKKIWEAFTTYAEYRLSYLRAKTNGSFSELNQKTLSLQKQKQALLDISPYLEEKVEELIQEMKKG